MNKQSEWMNEQFARTSLHERIVRSELHTCNCERAIWHGRSVLAGIVRAEPLLANSYCKIEVISIRL